MQLQTRLRIISHASASNKLGAHELIVGGGDVSHGSDVSCINGGCAKGDRELVETNNLAGLLQMRGGC